MWAKARSEAVYSHIEQWENGSTCCPLNLYPLPRYPSGHYLMASEFYSGQLIFMSNLPRGQVVKKVKLHHRQIKKLKETIVLRIISEATLVRMHPFPPPPQPLENLRLLPHAKS